MTAVHGYAAAAAGFEIVTVGALDNITTMIAPDRISYYLPLFHFECNSFLSPPAALL